MPKFSTKTPFSINKPTDDTTLTVTGMKSDLLDFQMVEKFQGRIKSAPNAKKLEKIKCQQQTDRTPVRVPLPYQP